MEESQNIMKMILGGNSPGENCPGANCPVGNCPRTK